MTRLERWLGSWRFWGVSLVLAIGSIWWTNAISHMVFGRPHAGTRYIGHGVVSVFPALLVGVLLGGFVWLIAAWPEVSGRDHARGCVWHIGVLIVLAWIILPDPTFSGAVPDIRRTVHGRVYLLRGMGYDGDT